jgi:Zn-finger nucleic acid-binding protein
MNCPNCKNKKLLEKIKIGDVTIDRCPSCKGLWFERDELRLAKDKKLKDARWVDIELEDEKLDWSHFELWKDKVKFKARKDIKFCPQCQTPLNKVSYGDSNVDIDVCAICQGVWLDQGEFKQIIKYVKDKADYEVLNNYAKNLISETKEIFTGPESIQSEVVDLLVLIKLLKYKLAVQYPTLVKIFTEMPFTK